MKFRSLLCYLCFFHGCNNSGCWGAWPFKWIKRCRWSVDWSPMQSWIFSKHLEQQQQHHWCHGECSTNVSFSKSCSASLGTLSINQKNWLKPPILCNRNALNGNRFGWNSFLTGFFSELKSLFNRETLAFPLPRGFYLYMYCIHELTANIAYKSQILCIFTYIYLNISRVFHEYGVYLAYFCKFRWYWRKEI